MTLDNLMKTLTAEQLLDLHFSVSNCTQGDFLFEPVDASNGETLFNSGLSGDTTLSSKCGVHLLFEWLAEGGTESYSDAFKFVTKPLPSDPDFKLDGATLVDDDGDELSDWETNMVFLQVLENSDWKDAVSKLLPKPKTFDIDLVEDGEMETFVLERDNDRPIKFSGKLIACAGSSGDHGHSDYSGSPGRWTELDLYRTTSGKYICHQVGYTRMEGEHTRYKAAVCNTEEEVFGFFGHGWLAKNLYKNARLDTSVNVD